MNEFKYKLYSIIVEAIKLKNVDLLELRGDLLDCEN